MIDALLRADFADVDQALNAFGKLHEGAELHDVSHGTFDHRARREFLLRHGPGIAQRLLQAQRETAFGGVHSENHGLDGLANFYYVARSPNSLRPRHFRNVNQAFNPGLEFDERPEIGDAAYRAAHAFSGLVFFGDGVPRMRLELLQADRYAMLVRVDLDNLGFDALACGKHVGRLVDAAPW